MDLISLILIILGLCLFETINSVDNAVVNAEVLSTMSKKYRRWFLLWGLLFAIFFVRGFLPWIIVWVATPSLGFFGSLTATFSNDPSVLEAVETSAPILLSGAGIFLIFLFFHWLFVEDKHYGLMGERWIHSKSVWFFAVVSLILTVVVWFALQTNPLMAFGTVLGSSIFFIVHGFKQNVEYIEKSSLSKNSNLSDVSKIFYLEILDTTFSIDGVLGAFAFTLSVPLIIIGNGLGAFVVRELTIRNIEGIKKYIYLKNGAMYSILFLGIIMLADSFGADIPNWFSPVVTFFIIGFFLWKSRLNLKKVENILEKKK